MAAITYSGTTTFSLAWPQPVRPARPSSAAVYRRRRILAAAVVVALLLGILLAGSWVLSALGGGPLAASGARSPRVVTLPLETVSAATHVVAPGDTLWSIARQLQPEGDVRPLVDALASVRHGRALQVGERIRLP